MVRCCGYRRRARAACRDGRRRWTWHCAAFPLVRLLLLLFVPVDGAPETVPAIKDDTSPTTLPPCDVDGVASGDVTLQNGSKFAMTCTLTRWTTDEELKIEILRSRDRPVPESETRLNNATSVTWTRPHVTDADAGTYYCLVRGIACESVYNATGLVVGYAPQKPPTPACSGDKFETFECTWETPDNRVETRYTVSLLVGPRTAFSRIECKNSVSVKPRNLTCQLRTSGKLIYRIEEEVLRFEIVGSNKFGAKKWEYIVDHFANVVLEPPKVIYCDAMTFNASVNWTGLPRISTFPDVVYEVRVMQDNGKDITVPVKNRHVTSIGNLTPNTRYDISVRVKFVKAADRLWSPFSQSRYCKTGKTRPTVLPKVAENSFIIQDLDDRRRVRLYYQRVPKFLWNGDHMSYVLHWCSSKGECGTHRVSGERSYADLFNLSRVESYTFHLYSENELGRSHRSVRVLVPSADLVLPPVQDAYVSEHRDSQPRFSLTRWEDRRPDEVHHYTLFWCSQDSKDAESCEGDVSWASVKSAGDAMTAVGCAFAGMCRYGVATRSAQSVSPMVWIECVVPRSKEYESLFQGQDAVHYDEITDTTVQFAFLTKCSGLVASRTVRVCAVQGQDEQRNETSLEWADDTSTPNGTDDDLSECFEHSVGHEKTVRLSDLKPATTYQANVKTTLEDGTTVKHRPIVFKTQAKSMPFLATSFIVLYVVLVLVAVAALLSWKRISDYISMYKNIPIKVLIPADFTREPIKKSESVRSNLREFVLGTKDCPYGLPQIVPREAPEVEDRPHCPELDHLIGEVRPCDPNEPDAAETSSVPEKRSSTKQPAAGYSLVSTTQDDPPLPGTNPAYSKLSTFHVAPADMREPPQSAPGYSRLSAMFLSGLAPSGAAKNGYSKFAAFLEKPSTGDEDEPETLKPPGCAAAQEKLSTQEASPDVQVAESSIHNVAEESPIQPYAKLGCMSPHPPNSASSSQGSSHTPLSRATGYTPLPSLLLMSKLSEVPPKASAGAECTAVPCLNGDAAGRAESLQPYIQASIGPWPSGTELSECRDTVGPYTVLNMDASLGDARDALPTVHCAPQYVKAGQQPSRASLCGDPSQEKCTAPMPHYFKAPSPPSLCCDSSHVKGDAPAPGYSKVGVPTAPPQDCLDTCARGNSAVCTKGTTVTVQPTIPETCFDIGALAPLACPEGSGVVSDRDELDEEWRQCAEDDTDLLSVEYSAPAAKESMSAKPTLRSGGYTSWEVLAKQRDGDACEHAVKNV